MDIFDTSYYDHDEDGGENWARMLPDGPDGHLVYLNNEDDATPTPYTVTLFHQLKCLELYHREYTMDPPPPKPSRMMRHCMNYLRQQILCQLDTKLESAKNDEARATKRYTSVCRDWTKVYEAASANQVPLAK